MIWTNVEIFKESGMVDGNNSNTPLSECIYALVQYSTYKVLQNLEHDKRTNDKI